MKDGLFKKNWDTYIFLLIFILFLLIYKQSVFVIKEIKLKNIMVTL